METPDVYTIQAFADGFLYGAKDGIVGFWSPTDGFCSGIGIGQSILWSSAVLPGGDDAVLAGAPRVSDQSPNSLIWVHAQPK
jgi:hypothetical protein